jgi:hypothetical protein
MFLPSGMIDRGLAAHRGIDLRQQRGRDLDEGHAALVAGGGKAAHVADHPAAERDQGGRLRSQRSPSSMSKIRLRVSQSLWASPSGSTTALVRTPPPRDRLRRRSR